MSAQVARQAGVVEYDKNNDEYKTEYGKALE
jgi:hypothetical protein